MERDTILVPLDGSPQSEAALPYASAVARATGRSLRLLSIVDPYAENALIQHLGRDSDLMQQLRSEAGNYLSQRVTTISASGVQTSSAVLIGTPAEGILRAAEAADVAMVVMATHGRGGLQRWALGSVADRVMRMSEVPTLLVRPPDSGAAPRKVELRRLLVPLDGSELAEAAVAPAVELAQGAGATIVLLRVEPWLSSQAAFATEGMSIPNLGELEDEMEAAAKEYVEGIRSRLPASVQSTAVVLRGFVAPILEAYIAEGDIDLVVMSTHGRGGLERFVLGSKADGLVRSGAPTLLIHPSGLSAGEKPRETETATAP